MTGGLPSRVIHCHVEGIQGKGRQRKRWTDDVEEDVKVYNLNWRTAIDMARGRE